MVKEFTIKLFATEQEMLNLNEGNDNFLDAATLGIDISLKLQDALNTGCHDLFVNIKEAIKV